jgi:hypothetical protein
MFIRNVYGTAYPEGKDNEELPFEMTVNHRGLDIPLNRDIKVEINDKTPKELKYKYVFSSSVVTKFDGKPATDRTPEDVKDVLKDKGYFVEYDEFDDHFDELKDNDINAMGINKADRNFICTEMIVEGIKLKEDGIGQRKIFLNDTDRPKTRAIMGEVPPHLFGLMDFAEDSRIMVIGTLKIDKWNPETRQTDDSLRNPKLKIHGMYAIPELKIEIPENVEEVSVNDDQFEDEEDEEVEEEIVNDTDEEIEDNEDDEEESDDDIDDFLGDDDEEEEDEDEEEDVEDEDEEEEEEEDEDDIFGDDEDDEEEDDW